jgi:hypothetical protein
MQEDLILKIDFLRYNRKYKEIESLVASFQNDDFVEFLKFESKYLDSVKLDDVHADFISC